MFYANLGASSNVGPSLVTLSVVADTGAAQASSRLVQTLQPPTDLGGGKYTFCNPTVAGCTVQTRVLARGLASPIPNVFSYYNFAGAQITSTTLTSADLASVASVELNLSVQTVRGQARYPASTLIKRIRLPNSDINVLAPTSTATP